jgi:hypothetical protein
MHTDILAEHRLNMKQYEQALDNERIRQKELFVKKLNVRKKQQQKRREERENKMLMVQ